MRKLSIGILMIGLFLFTGCSASSEPAPETPNTMQPAIFVEGELYYTTGMEMPIEPAEEAIKKVTGVTDHRELPKKEGEINFPVEDAVYARISDGKEYVVVLIESEWVRFEKREE